MTPFWEETFMISTSSQVKEILHLVWQTKYESRDPYNTLCQKQVFLLQQVDRTRLTSNMRTTTSKNRFLEDFQSSCSKKYEDLEGSSLRNTILLIGYDHGDRFD